MQKPPHNTRAWEKTFGSEYATASRLYHYSNSKDSRGTNRILKRLEKISITEKSKGRNFIHLGAPYTLGEFFVSKYFETKRKFNLKKGYKWALIGSNVSPPAFLERYLRDYSELTGFSFRKLLNPSERLCIIQESIDWLKSKKINYHHNERLIWISSLTGEKQVSLNDFETAKKISNAYLIMEDDEGDLIYLTAPMERVLCSEAVATLLLEDIFLSDLLPSASPKLNIEVRLPGENIRGGMEVPLNPSDIWIDNHLESKGLGQEIRDILAGKKPFLNGPPISNPV